MFGFISDLLNALGATGDLASNLGKAMPAVGDFAGALKPWTDVAGSLGKVAGGVNSAVSSASAIGNRSGSVSGGGSQSTGLTPDAARTGLAGFKSNAQAAGLSGLNDDAMIEQYAAQLGIPVEQLRELLGSLKGVS